MRRSEEVLSIVPTGEYCDRVMRAAATILELTQKARIAAPPKRSCPTGAPTPIFKKKRQQVVGTANSYLEALTTLSLFPPVRAANALNPSVLNALLLL